MTASNRFLVPLLKFIRISLVLLLSLCAILCSVLVSYANSQSFDTDIDVEISFDKENYKPGDNVSIMLSVTNNTEKKIENISARYYIPSCFDVNDASLVELGVLNSRQTVRTQLQARANTEVGRDMLGPDNGKDNHILYITLLIVSAVVFIGAVTLLIFRERSRRKVAATISFCLAFFFCLAPIVNAADTNSFITEDASFGECRELIEAFLPETVPDIGTYLPQSGELTREKAAFILSVMTLGGKELPEISSDPYTDVGADSLYAPFIKFSVSSGLIPSISATKFYPTNRVSGYEFLSYALRALGLGQNGEYLGQNGRAYVIYDTLRLPFTETRELLSEDFVSCDRALAVALRIMTSPAAQRSEIGTYTLTAPSLISAYEGVTQKAALALDNNTLVCEGGEIIRVADRTLDSLSYSVFSAANAPRALSSSSMTLTSSFSKLHSGKEEMYVGVGIEHSVPYLSDAYSMIFGEYKENDLVLTSDNIHFRVDPDAFDSCVYMLDSRPVQRSEIDYNKPITVIIRSHSELINLKINDILYVYQLSSNEIASYDAYNAALESARTIKNEGSKTYLPSAYESFVDSINTIDASLSKTLTDTDESRSIIATAEQEILNAIEKLSESKLVSYEALDAEIAAAEGYLSQESSYTQDSFADFKEAYDEAVKLSRELVISEENEALVASATSKLKSAVEALVYSDYCDYTAYHSALDSALAINNDSGRFTQKNFKTFTDTVNSVKKGLAPDLPRSAENQKKIDDATKKINDAIATLNSTLPCDYTALDSALEDAKDINNDNYQYNSSSFAEFTEALNAAKKIKRNMTVGYGNTNQAMIDSAAKFLRSAMGTLIKNDYCNYQAFDTALKNAKELSNTNGAYSSAAFTAYLETVDYIDQNLDRNLYKSEANNKKIQKAIDDLAAAKGRLEEGTLCSMAELLEALDAANAKENEGLTKFSAKTVAIFNAAKQAAQALVDGGDLGDDIYGFNQEKINNAARALTDAIDQLTVEEIFTSQVIEVLKSSGDQSTHSITLLYREEGELETKATKFTVSSEIYEILASASIGDVVFVTTENGVIVSAQIIIPEVKQVTPETDLSGYAATYHLSYEEYIPQVGELAVFFTSSNGELLFVSSPEIGIYEITLSDNKFTAGGKDLVLSDPSLLNGTDSGALVRLIFGGRYVCIAEKLTSLETAVSLDGENAVYANDGANTVLTASEEDFVKADESTLITLDTLKGMLGEEGAPSAYETVLWLDKDGSVVACDILGSVIVE